MIAQVDHTDCIVTEWDEEHFLASQDEWQKLLDKSNADPFFMSWKWMSQWWLNWGKSTTDTLSIIVIYLSGEPVGIAPLYVSKSSYLKGLLPVRRLQFLGSRFRGNSGIRSEYLNTIVKQGLESEVNPLIIRAILSNRNWDEIVFSDLVKLDCFHQQVVKLSDKRQLRIRQLGADACYSVNTTGSFSEYLDSLGKNTRLKLFNRRKVLAEYGKVSLEYVDLRDGAQLFQCINEFHLVRYGKPAFTGLNIKGLRNVINSLPDSAQFKCSSLLLIDKKPVSAIVNVLLSGKIYNIQLGFLEDLDKKISLGTLHLGYTLEMAFESDKITTFDFLAGRGKNSNYKAHLGRKHSTLESLQVLKSPVLRLLYFVNDSLKRNYTN